MQNKLLRYAQDKFEINSFVYLTKGAYDAMLDECGESYHRGPWQVSTIGAETELDSKPYMGLFNPCAPTWEMTSYIDDDTAIQDWLTSDEFHIERIKEWIWERSFYEKENSAFLNKDGIEDRKKLDLFEEWAKNPHLWVPFVGDEIYAQRKSHRKLFEAYSVPCPPFVKCFVLSVDKLTDDSVSWNPHGLPTLTVKPVQHDAEIEPIDDIDTKLCYPAAPNSEVAFELLK